MSHTIFRSLVGSLVAVVLATHALAAVDLPVRALSAAEISALSSVPQLALSNVVFKTAATVSVSVPTSEDAKTVVPVTERRSNQDAKAYQSLPHSSPPLLPPMPSGVHVFDFKVTGDSAQAWSTMSRFGVPYMFVQGSGEFEASATAAWTAAIRTPSTASSSELIVRFSIPPAAVSGTFEQDGPALYQSRLRVEFLVDGYPAWSTEAIRFNLKAPNNSDQAHLETFGASLGLPTAGIGASSALKMVYLTLGAFPPDHPINLTMVLRGETRTVDDPDLEKKRDNACKGTDNYFCTRGTVTVEGDADRLPGFYFRAVP